MNKVRRVASTAGTVSTVSPGSTGSSAVPSKAGSDSLRGRISGPIPIPSVLDDEHALEAPGRAIVQTPHGARLCRREFEHSQPGGEKEAAAPHARPARASAAARDASGPVRGEPEKTSARDGAARSRARQPSSMADHSPLSADPAQAGDSKQSGRRTRSLGFRGALGRLMRLKKRHPRPEALSGRSSAADGARAQGLDELMPAAGSTRSQDSTEPPQFRTSPEPPQRSAQITEGQGEALCLGDAGSGDKTVDEAGPKDFGLPPRQTEAAMRSTGHAIEEFSGLSPRPPSTHGRGSKLVKPAEDQDLPRRAASRRQRRSRSLTGPLGRESNGMQGRHRGDEFLYYWRESSDYHSYERRASLTGDETDVFTEAPRSEHADPPRTPLQPFNFGEAAAMEGMADMKITQAASLDARISSIERRMRRLEKVTARLYDASSATTGPDAVRPASGSRSAYQASVTSSSRPSTSQSVLPCRPLGGPNVMPPATQMLPTQQAHESTDRPISTATVRAATSLPMLPREVAGPFTIDHYTTLMALIETERSARLALEAQVRQMRHQISLMARASLHAAAGGDVSKGSSAPDESSTTSAFEHDDDDDDDDDEAQDEALVAVETEGAEKVKTGPHSPSQRLTVDNSGTTTEPEEDGRSSLATSRASVFREEFGELDNSAAGTSLRAMPLSQMFLRKTTPVPSSERTPLAISP